MDTYCHHLLGSGSGTKQDRALRMISERRLLDLGMTVADVNQLVSLPSMHRLSPNGEVLKVCYDANLTEISLPNGPHFFLPYMVATFGRGVQSISPGHSRLEYRLTAYEYLGDRELEAGSSAKENECPTP